MSDVNLHDLETEAAPERPAGYEISRARVGELVGGAAAARPFATPTASTSSSPATSSSSRKARRVRTR